MRSFVMCLTVLMLVGCATQRTVTISTKPADAVIKIDNVDAGKGPLRQQFSFGSAAATHRIAASRLGYKDAYFTLTRDYDKETLLLELKPQTKRISVSVSPVPANLAVNGRPLANEPQAGWSGELEFTVDAQNKWNSYTLTAERQGFVPAQATVSWNDRDTVYVLQLEPMRKDIVINSIPSGAEVFVDGELIGKSPVKGSNVAFHYDVTKEQFIPRKIKLTKPGFDPMETEIAWDEGRSDYTLNLMAKQKAVKIATDPPGAVIMIDGKELQRDDSGASQAKLEFPPDDKGELRTYKAVASKKTAQSEWYPLEFTLGWDNGKTDYAIRLREIKTMPVNLLRWQMTRADGGWEVEPTVIQTIAAKDTGESAAPTPPTQITQMPKGTMIDSLAVSPDGSSVLFATLYGRDKNDFRSQLFTIKTDGTGGASVLTDGKSLDLMPAYSPDGTKIVFSSDRAGKRLSIWRIDASGAFGIENITTGETNDLWPSLDSDPKQRLFYQAMIDRRSDPRIYMVQLGTSFRTDLTQTAGMQPRINPSNDTVLFTSVNEKTGKRDIFKMSDKGGMPQNITNTPDIDEYDAAWSRDGSKIAFVSDRGVDEERRNNADIWLMDLAQPDQPTQLTSNASHDDSPAWDPSGEAIYFRSNRGGEWAIWKLSVK